MIDSQGSTPRLGIAVRDYADWPRRCCIYKTSFASRMLLDVVVLRKDDAACVGMWMYFFSASGARVESAVRGRQSRESPPREVLITPSGKQARLSPSTQSWSRS